MIYKNEDNTNVLQFGTGDIEVGNGRVPINTGDESYPCVVFIELEKPSPIGDYIHPDAIDDPAEERSDAHTTMVFTDPRSIDVVIEHLIEAKERFRRNGNKVLTMQEITDEVPNGFGTEKNKEIS